MTGIRSFGIDISSYSGRITWQKVIARPVHFVLARASYISNKGGRLYVGANAVLSDDELYWDLKTTHYWKSGSTVPDIPHRGYQMFQTIKAGHVDRNVIKDDNFGNAVMWLTK